tara:strand:- start:1376 stop:1918 length:543 start_codon:yes stop_codon:yes gene_type:complete
MADITPAKNNIKQEETDYKSAVSEQLLTKVGGSINFINNRQMCVYDFKFFGPFRAISGGEDGAHIPPYNIEICAISFRLRDCGSSGNTTVDLHKINTSGVDQGSIFTNKIIVAHNETNEKGFFVNFIASTSNNVDQAASQMPTMTDSNRLVNAGESIRLDVDGNATGAKDLVVYIYYRPV